MIIFVNILLDKELITSNSFTALLLMAVASTILTIPMVHPKLQSLKSLVFKINGTSTSHLQGENPTDVPVVQTTNRRKGIDETPVILRGEAPGGQC
jgi:hypothetical protein